MLDSVEQLPDSVVIEGTRSQAQGHRELYLPMGQTVGKPRVQPGKTVPREFPRDCFSRLPEAFQQLVRLC